ncbi:MAG: Crp/Fnr family transcriptional regulator [Candidatus Marinimicrobia bacterium]|nr:Crp/Fnr family transcriptional regulator [Candidatus Neomarinimicrobiota bacterium]
MSHELLKNLPLFGDLDDGELVEIWNHVQTRSYKKGNIILFEEDPGDSLFIIKEGKVKITRLSEEGREVILSILGEGEFFGEMSILDGESRSANVIALADSEVFVLKREEFINILTSNPQIAITLLEELAARIRKSDQQIEYLSLADAENRVAMTLLRLAEESGTFKMGQVTIEELPMQQDMANMSGTSRETISRMLSEFTEKEYIDRKGKKLIILDYDKFRSDFTKRI